MTAHEDVGGEPPTHRRSRGLRVTVGALLAVGASALVVQRAGGFDPPTFTDRLDARDGARAGGPW